MYKAIFDKWISSEVLSDKERDELLSIQEDQKEIEYRFGKNLEFGTAGMRGIIGLGTNMMNIYTVRQATQGLCEYIKSLGKSAIKRGVVISFDTRKMSSDFAYNAAVVLATNGIKTYLFNDVHPVPMLSYAVRELKTVAGIMITASHNPKEYNGYKVYGEDGAQMSPEATSEVVSFIEKIGDPLSCEIQYNEYFAKRIIMVSNNLDKKYYKSLKKLALSPKQVKKIGKTLKIIYTPVHGSGYVPVTTILKKIGIEPMVVPEQICQDCEFSTVEVPNPEYKETLSLGIKMADFKQADVVFGTDPDADRLGVAIRDDNGEFLTLSGNQVGALLLDYILLRLKEQGKLNSKGFVVKSFVTTSLASLIAQAYGVELLEVPVGFKFIGEKIKQLDDTGKRKFVFGFEESCGYLRGTHCRDKDAVVASMLFAEMVCYYTYIGCTVYSKLQEIYSKFGYVFDTNVSTQYKGLNAMQDMCAVVEKLKGKTIASIGGIDVVATRDYSAGKRVLADGTALEMSSPMVNAVYYELNGGGFVCLRPSGTEPKLKVYYSLPAKDQQTAVQLFETVKSDFETYIK